MTVSAYGNIPENKQNENEQAVKEPVQEEKMGILGWMNPEDYSFDCMLRMERFQIRYILGNPDEAGKKALAMALKANPKVAGLFMSKCPEMAETVKTLTAQVPAELTPEEIRTAEVQVIGDYEDFVIYTTPNLMPEKCDFIYGWHKERCLSCAAWKERQCWTWAAEQAGWPSRQRRKPPLLWPANLWTP